jgi:hypothetical protein
MSDPGLGLLLLSLGFEEKLGDFADGQALGQVVERSVFVASMMAGTVLFAANGEALDKRGAKQVLVDFELGQQQVLTLAQREGGLAAQAVYPSHR